MARRKSSSKYKDEKRQPAGKAAEDQQTAKKDSGESPPKERQAPFGEVFQRVRDRANRGDVRAQSVLTILLDGRPDICSELGDMAKHAERSLIETITQNDWVVSRAIKLQAAKLRKSFSRPGQTPLEDLAVQRIVACWLQLQFVESKVSQANGELERAKFWSHRQNQAHRLYEAAERSLVLLRSIVSVPTRLRTRTSGYRSKSRRRRWYERIAEEARRRERLGRDHFGGWSRCEPNCIPAEWVWQS